MDHLLHQIDEEEPGEHGHLRHGVMSLVDESHVHGVLEVGLRLRQEVKEHDGEENAGAETQTHGEANLRRVDYGKGGKGV